MYSYILPICILIIVIVSYTIWRTRSSKATEKATGLTEKSTGLTEKATGLTATGLIEKGTETKEIVYAINDNGVFDIADANGKMLNIGYGPNPKVYINLLYQAEKDIENNDGVITSKINTKSYEIGGRSYIIDFTRL